MSKTPYLDYGDAVLCVSIAMARGSERVSNVKVVRGTPSKDELEAMGLVALGRHPDPRFPGQMVLSDPAVDRENAVLKDRAEQNEKANQDRMREASRKASA